MRFTLMSISRIFTIWAFLSDPEEGCHCACSQNSSSNDSEDEHETLYGAWLASRLVDSESNDDRKGPHTYSRPGAHRSFTPANIVLAYKILKLSLHDMLALFWDISSIQTLIFVIFAALKGLFPAFRGYSQALILDEVQKIITSGGRPSNHIVKLILREGARMLAESIFDAYAHYNESIVYSSMRYAMEYRQMKQRLRLDFPTIADPNIRDLLYESDLFIRSCTATGTFGPLSPFELLRVSSTFSELFSQLFVLYTISRGSLSFSLLVVLIFPTLSSMMFSCIPLHKPYTESLFTSEEAKASERQEQMRSMAYSESYKSEVLFFDLGPWILRTWSTARKQILGLENLSALPNSNVPWLITQSNVSDILLLVQNLPYLIYSSTTSLGSLTLYRNSVQSLVFTVRSLARTCRAAFQSIFFMGAFLALMSIEPKLSPKPERRLKYSSTGRGMKIEARNISFTYPGNQKPTLKNINFSIEAGETLAIVGYNGSGKSTLANILLRMFDFEGHLLINGTDIRHFEPDDYHSHVSALFQSFSKFNTSVRENVGIGNVKDVFSDSAIYWAANHAGAKRLINSLPLGLETQLDCVNNDYLSSYEQDSRINYGSYFSRQGLSGGEWQKIALSRTFMRAQTSDMLLLDEPTSHLDAHAQNNVLNTIDIFKRTKSGEKMKTVIIITHQLSIAKRADKIAMLQDGTITEFGTHEELLSNSNSHYAALYKAIA